MTVPSGVVSDTIEDTFMIQRLGRWVYAEKSMNVTTTSNPYNGTRWMDTNPDIPNIGAQFSTVDVALQDLRLEERELRVFNVDGARNRVRLRLIYRFSPFAGTYGQTIMGTGTHRKAVRGGASLSQTRTALDAMEMPIIVRLDTTDEDGDPVTLTSTPQEIDVTVPQAVTTRRVVFQTNTPEQVVLEWVGYVNTTAWASAQAFQWLCIDCQYQEMNLDASPPWYDFQFEFMLSSQDPTFGWDYLVPYRDSSGRIPDDVTITNGIKQLAWHPNREFNTLF